MKDVSTQMQSLSWISQQHEVEAFFCRFGCLSTIKSIMEQNILMLRLHRFRGPNLGHTSLCLLTMESLLLFPVVLIRAARGGDVSRQGIHIWH